jgi:hypothetical protein
MLTSSPHYSQVSRSGGVHDVLIALIGIADDYQGESSSNTEPVNYGQTVDVLVEVTANTDVGFVVSNAVPAIPEAGIVQSLARCKR